MNFGNRLVCPADLRGRTTAIKPGCGHKALLVIRASFAAVFLTALALAAQRPDAADDEVQGAIVPVPSPITTAAYPTRAGTTVPDVGSHRSTEMASSQRMVDRSDTPRPAPVGVAEAACHRTTAAGSTNTK